MTFVREKVVKGTAYRYLVKGIREGGKVHQKVVAYLGAHKSVKAAYAYWQRESKKKGRKTYASKMMKKLQPHL